MINPLTHLLILTIFFADYVQAELSLHRLVTWAPEGVAGCLLVLVALRGAHLKVPGKYVIWGLMFLLLVVIGLLANDVQPGAIFYGARKYFRVVPLFLVPLVFPFTESQIRSQLRLILILTVIQIIPAGYQRWIEFPDYGSGDVVVGTLMVASHLSVVLLATLAVLTAFYVRGRLPLLIYLPCALLLAAPTFINETAANVVLLPMAIVLPLLLSGSLRLQIRRFLPLSFVLVLLVGTFVASYSAQFDRWDLRDLVRGQGVEYVYRGATEESRADDGREQSEIGRLDSAVLPFLVLDDPVQWLVGVGMGNASSTFNRILMGDYAEEATERYGSEFTTASALIWELGVLGLLMSLVLAWMMFKDGRSLCRLQGFRGSLGVGWSSVLAMTPLLMLYTNLVDHSVTSFLAALIGGHVAASRRDAVLHRTGMHPAPPLEARLQRQRILFVPSRQHDRRLAG